MDCANETSSKTIGRPERGGGGCGGFLINELVEKISGNDKQVYVKAFQKQNPHEWLDRLKGIIYTKSNKQKGTTLRFT
jgi:hypothetical protein